MPPAPPMQVNRESGHRAPKPGLQAILVVFLLAFFAAECLISIRHLSLTADEPAHYRYGLQILSGDATRFDDSKMPFSAANAVPGWLAERIPAGQVRDVLEKVTVGRAATVAFGLLLGLLVFFWSRRLYGAWAGLLSLALFTFEPNIVAHAQLVTTDLYAAGMIFASVAALWAYVQRPGGRQAAQVAAATGLAQIAKYTSVFLFPLHVLLLAVHDFPALRARLAAGDRPAISRWIRQRLGPGLAVLLASVLAIQLGFLFQRSMTPLVEYRFKSDLFLHLQQSLGPLNRAPVPLPYSYLEGLDLVRYRERSGQGYGRIYLMGKLSETGFPGYFLIAWLFKVPLGLQLLLLLAAWRYLRNRRLNRFLKNEWFLLGPVIFFTLYFNFFYRAQIGIRHYLVVFPFVLVFAGYAASDLEALPRRLRNLILLLAAWAAISALSYFPHSLAYFNELVPDRRQSYRILADSNLDWGQSRWYLDRYLELHPEAEVEPQGPVHGLVIVGVNNLTGVTSDPNRYLWLRNGYAPVDTIAYSYLVYEIP